MERGATDDQIRKFAGENILRVWSEVEKVAERIQAEGRKPNEAIWEGRTWVRSEMSPCSMSSLSSLDKTDHYVQG